MKILVPFKSVPDQRRHRAGRSGFGGQIGNQSVRRNRHRGSATHSRTRRCRGDCGCHDRTAGGRRTNPRRVSDGHRSRYSRRRFARALDPYAVARILRAVVEKEMPHIVIMGEQAMDDDSNQVGQMLAALLRWPQATFVSKIEFLDKETRARCTRETDSGLEVVAIELPAIITTDLRLNEPRYVSLPGLMKARRRPIEILTCDQLRVAVRPLMTVLSIASPPKRAAGTRVDSVEELIARLRQEAKVL